MFDVFYNSSYKPFDRKFKDLIDYVANKTNCTSENQHNLSKELRNFKNQLKSKWLGQNRHKEKFLNAEKSWLNDYCNFTLYSGNKGGRPTLTFEESSENTKRRKTAHLRSEAGPYELSYAAQMQFRATGKSTEASVIAQVAGSPQYAMDCFNIASTVKAKKVSPRDALSLIIEAQLSRKQYEVIRTYAKEVFPSYKEVQAEKVNCYPKDLKVTETDAEVPLQCLLDHTGTRLLQTQKSVLEADSEHSFDKILLYSKWGFDGSSSHTQYKQKFMSETSDDKYMFLTCLVPLRLIGKKNGKSITLWQNPRPSSPRFCRPISLEYKKETEELVKSKKEHINKQIKDLVPTEVNLDGKKYLIEHHTLFTMVDGKLCNCLSDTKSTMRCYLCDATSKEFNDLDMIKNRPIKSEYVSFGISVLHAWIRSFESLLHLSYKLPVRNWRVSKTNKELIDETKKDIQTRFKNKLSLIVDKPKPGFGNSNDGNVARKFFQNFKVSSSITNIDEELIRRIYMILQTISSGFQINTEKFQQYCLDTAQLYVDLYPWMPMTPTLHKLLIHSAEIVNHALLPIGMLSEEAQEARNKDFKSYRENFARKTSRTDNLTDIVNRLFISSDPIISLNRTLPNYEKKNFDSDVLNMLEQEL